MEKERILIKEDRELLKKICRDIPEYVPLLNKVKECYEKLELGDFSQEIYEEIINFGENKSLKKFHSFMINQFDKANITSTIIRASMMSDTLIVRESFKNSVQELKSFKPFNIEKRIGERYDYLKLNQITYENGRFFISDENEENILEQSCRKYLESDRDHMFFELINKYADSYKDLKLFLIQNNFYRNPNHAILSDFVNEQDFASGKPPININSVVKMLNAPEFIKRMSQS